jgi:hypothetical protein
MKLWIRDSVLMILALVLVFFVASKMSAYASSDGETWKKYGRNIFYYDLSEIPENSIEPDLVALPADLEEYINAKYHLPNIENKEKFSADFWEEAQKLGYTKQSLAKMGPKDAIMAAVKITAARFTYFLVDTDKNFTKKYGKNLPIEEYFHLKLGDCDKYRDATIAAFAIVKSFNPKLKNVYLTNQELGGRGMVTMHAWVAIVIPAKDRLMLSHIDPTFYDSGGSLEADKFHITLKHEVFKACFYYALTGRINMLCAYDILKDAYSKADSNKEREGVLCRMADVTNSLSIYDAKAAPEKISFVLKEYERNKFQDNQDDIWYCAYRVFSAAGNDAEKENYKQKLVKYYPKSYWTRSILKDK